MTDIVEDRSGDLWVATQFSGVSRYDGARWTTYGATSGLPTNFVSAAALDSAGNVWLGTDTGVSRFDGRTFASFTASDGFLASTDTRAILADRSGRVWFGHWGAVSCLDGAEWRRYYDASGHPIGIIQGITEDHSGDIWFAGSEGVLKFDGAAWTTFTRTDGLADTYATDVTVDRDGNVWASTLGGLSRYDGMQWKGAQELDGVPGGWMWTVQTDRSGDLWAAQAGAGVWRFNGSTWQRYTTSDGLAENDVGSVYQDRSGNVWFGTFTYGLSRFDHSEWRVMRRLETDGVTSAAEDSSGNIWIGTFTLGVQRFDGTAWMSFGDPPSGPGTGMIHAIATDRGGTVWCATPSGAHVFDGTDWRVVSIEGTPLTGPVYSILVDHAGGVWLGSNLGAYRFDGSAWTHFDTSDGLGSNEVYRMAEDPAGGVWFGSASEGGITRFDGTDWIVYSSLDDAPIYGTAALHVDRAGNLWHSDGARVVRFDGHSAVSFTNADGLASNDVRWMIDDSAGTMWLSTIDGVTRFDGARWKSFTIADGLPGNQAFVALSDRNRGLWFGTNGGVTRHLSDRVPPRTAWTSRPDTLSTSRSQSATFVAAFGEVIGIQFSTRYDEASWSDWTDSSIWTVTGIPDGVHTLEIRARDYANNTELLPARVAFEVDATPPTPELAYPRFGDAVRGTIQIIGTATDLRFRLFRLEYRPSGAASWQGSTLLAESASPVTAGVLAAWNTAALPDGGYDLRVSVADSLGLVGNVIISVVVDNRAPFFDETAPATVTATSGGHVYTTNAETHLYFPPHAFAQDAMVLVTALGGGSVPTTLPNGAARVLDGFELAWAGSLRRPARFTLSYGGASLPPGVLALYHSPGGSAWERLGGTVDAEAHSISLAVSAPGRYALFADDGLGVGTASLSPIAFTPRVFSPTGAFADRQVGISFRLAKPAPVTVKVFSRSGRLIREVATGVPLQAGENLIPWDGTDRNGGYVVDGVYFVTVEALGQTHTRSLAVVK